jgi:hypothetical protein
MVSQQLRLEMSAVQSNELVQMGNCLDLILTALVQSERLHLVSLMVRHWLTGKASQLTIDLQWHLEKLVLRKREVVITVRSLALLLSALAASVLQHRVCLTVKQLLTDKT